MKYILIASGVGAILSNVDLAEENLTNRLHVDAPAGIIDIEGEKDFVEGLLAKLFPLIEKAGFGSHPPGPVPDPDAEPESTVEDVVLANNGTTKSKTRRISKKPPAGHSCGERILTLKADGFFKQRRTTAEIVEGLKTKGWTHNTSQVSAAAGDLFKKKGELQRTIEGKSQFYSWDRD
jgi:hypothetical protein